MTIAVLGAGSWGTAMARLLANKGHRVILWARDPKLARRINRSGANPVYLTEVRLPRARLQATAELKEAASSELWVIAVPSFAVRELARRLRPHLPRRPPPGPVPVSVVNLAKGLERGTFKTMSQVLREELGIEAIFTLSGPSHAEEVGVDSPTSVVIAGTDLEMGRRLQEAFMTERFRVYLSQDLLGVEYAGTVKNVIALAAGISDGLGFGDNAKGALIARGLAEMVRLGDHLGARRETLFGLSGLGDLVATCTSAHSRNRTVGERLGRGERLQEVLAGMTMVAEGVTATRAVHELAQKYGVDMPITAAVYAVLYQDANPLEQLTKLMTRQPKMEGV